MIKILSIFILVFISYFPAINGGFIWDDDTFLTDNPIMAKPDALKRFWVTTEAPDYFPLVSTTLWLQRLIWGLNPMGYHIFNIVLHAFNGVMLWLILYKLRFRSAWLAATIFAVHPVHVESVAWITEIKNLQSTFFFMLSLICYLNFTNSQRKQWYLFSVIFFFMALLSKTSVVMLPILLLLYHWWSDGSLKKEILLNTIPFFTFSVFFFGCYYMVSIQSSRCCWGAVVYRVFRTYSCCRSCSLVLYGKASISFRFDVYLSSLVHGATKAKLVYADSRPNTSDCLFLEQT